VHACVCVCVCVCGASSNGDDIVGVRNFNHFICTNVKIKDNQQQEQHSNKQFGTRFILSHSQSVGKADVAVFYFCVCVCTRGSRCATNLNVKIQNTYIHSYT